jgi:hypothetical protein
MGRGTRFVAVLATAGFALLLSAGSASATFHLMKVREISPGTDGLDNSYVEVQMYAPFQSFLSNGANIATCDSTCSTVHTFFPFANVPNGDTQDTVLFGDGGIPLESKDFNVNLNLDQVKAGGAVCYVSEFSYTDCVSWGNFSANSTLTDQFDPSANPGAPASALSSGMALRRTISAGCPTALEASDDTNNSAADFSVTTPNPRKNSVAPTEMTCTTGAPTGSPAQPSAPSRAKKKKCKKRKPSAGSGTGGAVGNSPAYAAKKKCKKKRK